MFVKDKTTQEHYFAAVSERKNGVGRATHGYKRVAGWKYLTDAIVTALRFQGHPHWNASLCVSVAFQGQTRQQSAQCVCVLPVFKS